MDAEGIRALRVLNRELKGQVYRLTKENIKLREDNLRVFRMAANYQREAHEASYPKRASARMDGELYCRPLSRSANNSRDKNAGCKALGGAKPAVVDVE